VCAEIFESLDLDHRAHPENDPFESVLILLITVKSSLTPRLCIYKGDVFTMVVSLRNFLTCIMVLFAAACPCTSAKEPEAVLDKFKEQFDSLDPRGKFWVGAATGFVGSRLALSSAVTAVKVAGVAFVMYV
jgi:hypothetical protein